MADQEFEANFKDVQGGHQEKAEVLKPFYDQPGHMRDVCFVWPNGRRLALSYVDLISNELTEDGELMIEFSHMTVFIIGHNLAIIHQALMAQKIQYLLQQETQNYCPILAENGPVISKIIIQGRQSRIVE